VLCVTDIATLDLGMKIAVIAANTTDRRRPGPSTRRATHDDIRRIMNIRRAVHENRLGDLRP
jgi:hypothetical protein